MKTGYSQNTITATNAYQEALSSNPRRVAIVVSPGGLTSLRVSFGSNDNPANGMRIPLNGTPVIFDKATFGDAICQPLLLSAPDANESITVAEFVRLT